MERTHKKRRINIIQTSNEKISFRNSDKIGSFTVFRDDSGIITEIILAINQYSTITLVTFTTNKDFTLHPMTCTIDEDGHETTGESLKYINMGTMTRSLVYWGYEVCNNVDNLLRKFNKRLATLRCVYCCDESYPSELSKSVLYVDINKFIKNKYYLCSYKLSDVILMLLNRKAVTTVEECVYCTQLFNFINK